MGRGSDRLYIIWSNMKQRCNNPKTKEYHRYGGRGIKVCKEWENDFLAFRAWALDNSYADNLTIDRIDNDKGYSPDNCQWLTRSENSLKRGETMSPKGRPPKSGQSKADKNRADYMKSHRESKKTFSVLLDRDKAEAFEKKLREKNKTKSEWLNNKIDEEIGK